MSESSKNKAAREARLKWVPIPLMKVSPLAQRDVNRNRVLRLAANFDLEQLGNPTVSHRDGHFYIVDGQHRIRTLEEIGWGDQQVQCWTYEGLTEIEEAEMYLRLNDVLVQTAYSKFKISVHAGRPVETDIDRIVRANGLTVSKEKDLDGTVSAVGTLKLVYQRSDGPTLARTLRILRDAYGSPGLIAPLLDGVGLLCQRYNGELDSEIAVTRLGKLQGGVNGLLGRAEKLRRETGNARGHCVAAAAVDVINAGRGGKKLPSWWRTPTAEQSVAKLDRTAHSA